MAARNGWIKLARQQREYDELSHLGCHIDFAAIVRSKDRAWRQIHHGDETEGRQRREQSLLGGDEPVHDERQDAQRTLTNFSARGPQRPGLAQPARRGGGPVVVRQQGLVQPRYHDYVPEDCLIAGNVDASGIPANWAKQCAMGQPAF